MKRDLATTLGKLLDRRKRDEAELRPALVASRNTDGTVNLRPQDGECEIRGGINTDRAGSIVVSPSSKAFNRRGTAGIAAIARRFSSGALWVEALDPAEFAQGFVGDVTVEGRGFRPGMRFEFLLPDGVTIHPGITITATTFVSVSAYTLSITVAYDAALVDGAPLAWEPPRGWV